MKNIRTVLLPLMAGFILFTSFTLITLKPVNADNAVTFAIKNFGLNVNGELTGLKGEIKWDEQNIAAGSFAVAVDVNTINTGVESRDKHLRKEDYFNAEKYSEIILTSTALNNINGVYTAAANLSIKGTTKAISFPFTVLKTGNGYVFESSFTINRKDYNIGSSSMVLGDDVEVKLKIQALP